MRYFLTFCLLCCFACGKNIPRIADVPVNITIYPSTPAYFKLSAIGGWQYLNGGVKGIIVYHKDMNEYVAFERNSPYQPDNGCIIQVDTTNNIICFDPCSNSKFLLTDGSIQQGPATINLKKYATYWDGNALKISN